MLRPNPGTRGAAIASAVARMPPGVLRDASCASGPHPQEVAVRGGCAHTQPPEARCNGAQRWVPRTSTCDRLPRGYAARYRRAARGSGRLSRRAFPWRTARDSCRNPATAHPNDASTNAAAHNARAPRPVRKYRGIDGGRCRRPCMRAFCMSASTRGSPAGPPSRPSLGATQHGRCTGAPRACWRAWCSRWESDRTRMLGA